MKIRISRDYEFFRPLLLQITNPLYFDRYGETLHDGRNRIKLFECEGVKFVVKSYGHLTLFNRWIYGTLRRSKAERSFLNAGRLHTKGIDTPRAVAFAEYRRYGLLWRSYFVALYTDYLPLQPVVAEFPSPESRTVLNALAGFLVSIHRAGILYNDLNLSNVLYKRDDAAPEGCRFQVIDTNRLSFHGSLKMSLRLYDLRRMGSPVPVYCYILDRYARIEEFDPGSVVLQGASSRWFFELRQRFKHRLHRWR